MKKAIAEAFKKINFRKVLGYCIVYILIYVIMHFTYLFFLQKPDLQVLDFKQRMSLIPQDDRIVFIEVQDDSIEQIGRWPWSRDWHATLIAILSKYKAKAIIYDVIFSEPSTEKNDGLLAKAVGGAGNVYLPVIIECENVLSKAEPCKIFHNIPLIKDSARGIGHIVAIPDSDGVIRRMPLHLEYEGQRYPAIAYKVAADILRDKEKLSNISMTKNGNVILRWAGPWERAFHHISFVDVIKSYKQVAQGQEPIIDLSFLEGKICFIGLTGTALGDIKTSPMQHSYPGVGYNANLLNMIIQEEYVHQASTIFEELFVALLILLTMLTTIKCNPVKQLFGVIGFAILYSYFNLTIFKFSGLDLRLIYPVASMMLTYFGVNGYRHYMLAKERKKLFTVATTDGLTGVYNVRYFRELMEKVTSGACTELHYFCNQPFSLIICDIDKFKNFNDTYGHQVGDAVLKHFAHVLKTSVRGLDLVARYGGEEFVIVLFNTTMDNAMKIGEKVRANVENSSAAHEGKSYKLTASFGVAEFKKEKDNLETLVKRADDGLYKAKETGRNKVCSI